MTQGSPGFTMDGFRVLMPTLKGLFLFRA